MIFCAGTEQNLNKISVVYQALQIDILSEYSTYLYSNPFQKKKCLITIQY